MKELALTFKNRKWNYLRVFGVLGAVIQTIFYKRVVLVISCWVLMSEDSGRVLILLASEWAKILRWYSTGAHSVSTMTQICIFNYVQDPAINGYREKPPKEAQRQKVTPRNPGKGNINTPQIGSSMIWAPNAQSLHSTFIKIEEDR